MDIHSRNTLRKERAVSDEWYRFVHYIIFDKIMHRNTLLESNMKNEKHAYQSVLKTLSVQSWYSGSNRWTFKAKYHCLESLENFYMRSENLVYQYYWGGYIFMKFIEIVLNKAGPV